MWHVHRKYSSGMFFFFSMTVMEHMEFYAGVKSHQSAAETREEIWK